MATVAHAFSPKEFKCFVISDATNAGTTGIHSSNMQQLDVDSVGFPSLNVNQAMDVKSGVGHTLKDEDFFQDNKLRVVELSLSGTLHDDVAHRMLLANICGAAQADDTNQSIGVGHKIVAQKYGAAVTNNASSLTVVIQPSDVSNQQGLELSGCVVTSFAISADSGTEGGRYKWSATIQSGYLPDLDNTAAAGSTAYANTTTTALSAASGIKVYNTDAVLSSFTTTIDYPAVFTGVSSTGFEVVGRGTQTAAMAENSFIIVNNGNFGIDTANAVLTNVAYSEGDIMMLDVSFKAVDDGTDALLEVDLSN